jgi:hypothetical protein
MLRTISLSRRAALLTWALIAILMLSTLFTGKQVHAAQQPATVTLTSDSEDAHEGDPITFTAWVECDGVIPTGTVSFYDGDSLLETVDTADGLAITTATFTAGSHTISAIYSGDANCASSRAEISQIVGGGPTTTSVAASPNPATTTQIVFVTATVTALPNCILTGSPTVTFTDSTGLNVTLTLSYTGSSGTAKLAGTFSAGIHDITAHFNGLPGCGISSGTTRLTITGIGGTTSVVSNCPVGYPILGSVIITTAQTQPIYDHPDGDQIVDHDQKIMLPNDADHNGQDEYSVIAVQTVKGKLWYGLYIGSCDPVWVPASGVTVHNPITVQ